MRCGSCKWFKQELKTCKRNYGTFWKPILETLIMQTGVGECHFRNDVLIKKYSDSGLKPHFNYDWIQVKIDDFCKDFSTRDKQRPNTINMGDLSEEEWEDKI